MRLRSALAFGPLFLGAMLAVAGPSQERKVELKIDLLLRHEVTVTLKLIQVYVTDRAGFPVGDLTQEDFEILDEGKVQKIRAFENHVGPTPVAAPPAVTDAPSQTAKPLPTGRKFYFILDFFRNDPAGIKMAKKAVLALVDKLQAQDEVTLFSFSPREGLKLRAAPTSEKEKLRDSVEKTREVTHFKSLDPLLDPRLSLEKSGDETGSENLETIDLQGVLTEYFGALTDLAKALRTEPGFKNIVLFSLGLTRALVHGAATRLSSEGLSMGNIGGEDAEAYYSALMQFKQGSLTLSRFNEMTKEMASSNCLVYSVNTEANRAFLITGDSDFRGRDSLKSLSDSTGGRYCDSANQYEAVADSIHNVTKSYYVLGYYSERPARLDSSRLLSRSFPQGASRFR